MRCACGHEALIRLLNVPICADCYAVRLTALQETIRAFAERLTSVPAVARDVPPAGPLAFPAEAATLGRGEPHMATPEHEQDRENDERLYDEEQMREWLADLYWPVKHDAWQDGKDL